MAKQRFEDTINPNPCNFNEVGRSITNISHAITEIYNILGANRNLTVRQVDGSTIVPNVHTLEFGDCANVVYDRGENTARVIAGPFGALIKTDGAVSAWSIGDPPQGTGSVHTFDPTLGGLVDTGENITFNYIGATALTANKWLLALKDEWCDWWAMSPGCCDGGGGGGVTGTDPPTGGGGTGPGGEGGGGGGGTGNNCDQNHPIPCDTCDTLDCTTGSRAYQYDLTFTFDDPAGDCLCTKHNGQVIRVTQSGLHEDLHEAFDPYYPNGDCSWYCQMVMFRQNGVRIRLDNGCLVRVILTGRWRGGAPWNIYFEKYVGDADGASINCAFSNEEVPVVRYLGSQWRRDFDCESNPFYTPSTNIPGALSKVSITAVT